eukprot:scaffold320393_cov28-Tisochrysis_lutea.AAC.4
MEVPPSEAAGHSEYDAHDLKLPIIDTFHGWRQPINRRLEGVRPSAQRCRRKLGRDEFPHKRVEGLHDRDAEPTLDLQPRVDNFDDAFTYIIRRN